MGNAAVHVSLPAELHSEWAVAGIDDLYLPFPSRHHMAVKHFGHTGTHTAALGHAHTFKREDVEANNTKTKNDILVSQNASKQSLVSVLNN